jgi:uncharacterized protein
MGERSSYAPGTFCWADLSTPDPEGAKSFYRGLLGWEAEDLPGPAGTYTVLRLRGREVCALHLQPEELQGEVAPNWLSYVSVEDADRGAARAEELGAGLIAEPVDLNGAGRMAVLRDPQAAVLALWQPRENIGATLVNDPGCLCLNQLNTNDPAGSTDFYRGLFGWRIEQVNEEPPYFGIYNGERMAGGMMGLPREAQAPPHWLVYFTASDLDAAVAEVGETGGELMAPQSRISSGRLAVVRDPQGASFALYEGYVDP